jgi:hypothetical protein
LPDREKVCIAAIKGTGHSALHIESKESTAGT